MTAQYRIFGAELSPYSVKVRSYFRYKQIPHEWIVRDANTQEEFQKYAKLPLIPLVVTPESEGMQDSTPIIEKMEEKVPDPSIHPDDPVLDFLSALLEEYADEWGNKHMFHYRWAYEPDQIQTARLIAEMQAPDGDEETVKKVADFVRERMTGRRFFVGSSPETAPLIEASFKEAADLMEAHLEGRNYVMGGRPAFADFGLYAQFYEISTDPTAGAYLKKNCPNIMGWTERMLVGRKAEGAFEDWDSLKRTLLPFLKEEVGARFLPWSAANASAIDQGKESFTVKLKGGDFTQQPQKYHARSLGVLRARYAKSGAKGRLDPVLEATGCLPYLQS
ncbi:glutathione S-transferase family protein [Tepidicaulis sp. LMO-SS28]|uniref:glutathione S-transferase family protein n=1 Tax=Tepidicaulis sp. LMO-SS28 TaxID=3447455 RepID=UPI003EE23921